MPETCQEKYCPVDRGAERPLIAKRILKAWICAVALTVCGCTAVDVTPRKSSASGLIVTPSSYYTTARGRFLGAKYRENLDRLVEKIVRNPGTAQLQFANNIASVGGIGFFSHGATRTPDERYLEVILGVPDVFESNMDYAAKLDRIFSLYGRELLRILAGDPAIEQDAEVSGYGLNFSWRNVASKESASGVFLERTVVYLSKEKVRAFLRQQITPNDLLGDATLFAAEQDRPMNLISFKARGAASPARVSTEQPAVGESKPAAEAEIAVATATVKEQKSVSAATKSTEETAPVMRGGEVKTAEAAVVPKAEPKTSEMKPAPVAESSPTDKSPAPSSAPAERMPQHEAPAKVEIRAENAPPKSLEKTAAAQIASARVKPTEPLPEKKISRPPAKSLEGFIIQLAFTEANAAQRWAKTLEQRGYATSLTEAGADSIRLRVGNFAVREEADRQLRSLRREGLSGIVINLPQAYRPEPHSSSPGAERPVSINQ